MQARRADITEETFLKSSVIHKATSIGSRTPFKKGSLNAQKAFTGFTVALATKESLYFSKFLMPSVWALLDCAVIPNREK